jgi:hypothetical protein
LIRLKGEAVKTLLLLVVALLMTTTVASADVIGVYSDATGATCALAPGFTTTPTIIHKFTIGSRGSRFLLAFPPGSSVFSFTPVFPPSLPFVPYDGIAIDYGQCMQGSIVLGTITAILAPGFLSVTPAPGDASVMAMDCDLVENAVCGEDAYVGVAHPCGGCLLATDQKTWGAVKSLYRQ